MNYRLFEDVCRSALQPTECFVLLYLVCRADKDGVCYPSQGKIARDTKLHRNTVVKAISALVRMGALEVVAKQGKAITYRINLSGQDCTPRVQSLHTTCAGACTPDVQVVHTTSAKTAHHVCRDPKEHGITNEPPERTGWGDLLPRVKGKDPGATPAVLAFFETRMPELLAGLGIVNGTAERVLGAMAYRWEQTGLRPYDQLVAAQRDLGDARDASKVLAHRLTQTALGGAK